MFSNGNLDSLKVIFIIYLKFKKLSFNFTYLKNLQKLNFDNTPVNDAVIENLSKYNIPLLNKISLKYC